jgi:DNA-binding NarL/FixJ family response regulator
MAAIDTARAAFARQSWREALTDFTAAGESGALDAADHDRAAVCAYLIGEDDRCATAWEAAYRASLVADEPAHAARYAFWLAFILMLRGRMAQAGGWLTRTERLLQDTDLECAATGYLLVPAILEALESGEPSIAHDLAIRATELGDRFDDKDLGAFATLGHGQALIATGDITSGLARLDDVMVSVTSGEVGPVAAGVVYCAVVLECMQLFDMRRASEWTDALGIWCDGQPDLVPYRGQCLVHRSQLQQAAGDWPNAAVSAEAACRRLTEPPHPALGLAHYQQAELHRLVGDFGEAELEYRRARRSGHTPMPGLALLELFRGDPAAAAAGIDLALRESPHQPNRPLLLAAAVDIFLAAANHDGARAAADELATLAHASPSLVLAAMAAHATGSVLVAESNPTAALADLRTAAAAWNALEMPYEGARTAALIGRVCLMSGDRTSATMEFDHSTDVFRELGAVPDLDRLARERPERKGAEAGRRSLLSAREAEVLRHIAAGKTNREIAAALVLSQHTVSRHLENIFTKVGVTTRAAATAYAYEHGLV